MVNDLRCFCVLKIRGTRSKIVPVKDNEDKAMMKRNLRKKLTIVAAISAAFVTAIGLVGWKTTVYADEESAVIADHVTIGGVDVGGMTVDEATALLAERTSGCQNAVFTLTSGEKSIQVNGMDLGLAWGNPGVVEEAANIGKSGNLLARYKNKKELEQSGKAYPIVYQIDETETAALLNAQADALSVKAMNAGLQKTANGFEMTGGQTGVSVDVQESLNQIDQFIEHQWDGSDSVIALATVVTEPIGSANELSRVKDVLGSFHTDFSSSSSARCTNIERAASLINGTVLYPGEEFSVAGTIGPTNAENGYELAGAYENGQTVEAYGGGVCQVSSTLYNAVLFSELDVTVRSPHSMLVSYVEPSRDAAIAIDSGKDFRFKNNTDAPIYIEGYTSGKQLYFTIYGEESRPANRSISFDSEVTSQQDRTYSFVATADPIGYIATTSSAHIGKNAELWKIVTVDGVEESRERVNTSSYRGTPQTVAVGVSSLDPAASNAVSAAIASGDAYTVYSTVAAYSADPGAASNAAGRAGNVLSERATTAEINGVPAQQDTSAADAAAAAAAQQAAQDQAAADAAAAAAAAGLPVQ